MTKNLHSGSLYWPTTLQNVTAYPPLSSDSRIDTVIVGGGMSGLICGYVLAKSGIRAMIMERGKVADGSTSANTGLLQFSNDIMLSELMKQIGEKDALTFYRACQSAIEQIAIVANGLKQDVCFKRRSSLYYASSEQDLPKLRHEYEALRQGGFDVEYWEAADIALRFPFSKPGAIVTHGDAELNPYRFVNALAEAASEAGLIIHEHTDVVSHEPSAGGSHLLRTKEGFSVEAARVIFAVGYEPEELKGQLIKSNLNRTFVAVTEPQKDLSPWHQRFMLWETARPYLYMRTTEDNRVIIGGLDEEEQQPVEGEISRRRRTGKLYRIFREHFPTLDAPLAYEWNGTFGESCDNLPFIGEDPSQANVYYCLGYGGNGSVYSVLGAHLIRDLILGYDNPLAPIVGFGRATLMKA